MFIRAIRTSLFVGLGLTFINHYEVIFYDSAINSTRVAQIVLCFLVPFVVSLWSQLSLLRCTLKPSDG